MRNLQHDCPFCEMEKSRICVEGEFAFAILDRFPVANGHTLVIPKRHISSLFDLPADEYASIWLLVAQVRERLMPDLKPDGFNVGVNDGTAAGQTVTHAHVHIIPRRNGDVADPRGGVRWIIPENAPYWTGGQQ